jgi:predicted RNase H-like HicB family nuclease
VKDYHINIFWSDEDGAYVADIPDLVSCCALGATPQEALEQLAIAKDAWIEAAREQHKPVPPPSYRPLIYQTGG